jgi:hypothetical protein
MAEHQQSGASRVAFRGPSFMLDVLDRAATLMRNQWPRKTMIEFDWRTAGGRLTYRAVLEWPRGASAPRLVVFEAGSGDFRCQSLEGRPFAIDPEHLMRDVAAEDAGGVAARCPGLAPEVAAILRSSRTQPPGGRAR